MQASSGHAVRGSHLETLAGAAVSAVACTVLALAGFSLHLPLSAAEPLELLLVLLSALYLGLPQASVASVVAVLCLDYFFTQPLFQFTVADPQDWMALAIFETITLVVCRLSSEVRLNERKAREQERRALILYELSRAILYLEQKRPIVEQVPVLVQDLVGVEEVRFRTAMDDSPSVPAGTGEPLPGASDAYLGERNIDDIARRTSTRVLRIGVKAIGGMTLRGWTVDPLMADADA